MPMYIHPYLFWSWIKTKDLYLSFYFFLGSMQHKCGLKVFSNRHRKKDFKRGTSGYSYKEIGFLPPLVLWEFPRFLVTIYDILAVSNHIYIMKSWIIQIFQYYLAQTLKMYNFWTSGPIIKI